MSDFSLYLQLGLEHIADLKAYDHMLFVVVLCVLFTFKEWKRVLTLVTAFTIGHSITLSLSVLQLVSIDSDRIETLIPITILLACIYNIMATWKSRWNIGIIFHFVMATVFGFIHGMGFANYLKALLGSSEGIGWQLFSFNIGIELGQIGIVIFYFAIYYLLQKLVSIKHRWWVIVVSIVAGIMATWIQFS